MIAAVFIVIGSILGLMCLIGIIAVIAILLVGGGLGSLAVFGTGGAALSLKVANSRKKVEKVAPLKNKAFPQNDYS